MRDMFPLVTKVRGYIIDYYEFNFISHTSKGEVLHLFFYRDLSDFKLFYIYIASLLIVFSVKLVRLIFLLNYS